jgi:hypothetical protein
MPVLTTRTKLSTLRPGLSTVPPAARHEMHEYDVVSADQLQRTRAELLIEAMVEVRTRTQLYVQEPAENRWHDLVRALAHLHGDAEAYQLLRAVEIHARIASAR